MRALSPFPAPRLKYCVAIVVITDVASPVSVVVVDVVVVKVSKVEVVVADTVEVLSNC